MQRIIFPFILGAAAWLASLAGTQRNVATAAFSVVASTPRTLSSVVEAAALRSGTRGAISADKKTLTFRQKAVRLVVQSGPASDMLSYRIGSLRNPTIEVPAGATLRVLFINTDDDMTHNLRFGAQKITPSLLVGTPDLAHRTKTGFHAADVALRVPSRPGTYYYLCTIRGHAPGGMWGTIRVR